MIIRLYQAVNVIDKISGEKRYGCVFKTINHKNQKIIGVKFIGCMNPKITNDGDVIVEEGWKNSFYFDEDVNYLDECFDFTKNEGYFNNTVWDEEDDLYKSLLKDGIIKKA